MLIDNTIEECGTVFNPDDDYNASDTTLKVRVDIEQVRKNTYANVVVTPINEIEEMPNQLTAMFNFNNEDVSIELNLSSDDKYIGQIFIPNNAESGLSSVRILNNNDVIEEATFLVTEDSIVLTGINKLIINVSKKQAKAIIGINIKDINVKSFLFTANLVNSNNEIIGTVIHEEILDGSPSSIELTFPDIADLYNIEIMGLSDIVFIDTSITHIPMVAPQDILFDDSDIEYTGVFMETVKVKNTLFSLQL